MNLTKAGKKLYRYVLFLALLPAIFSLACEPAYAHNSKAWKERLAERTVTLWAEGQFLGEDTVLNARGELNVTWLERGLSRLLDTDKDVDEWVIDGFNYYFSNRKETRAKLKARDVFVLRYRAVKSWQFDPSKLIIGGYAVTPEDILTREEYWDTNLAPGYAGTLALAAPSLKPGQTVDLRYEDAAAQFEVPRRAR